MHKILQYAGQAIIYGGIIIVIGYFADTPSYRHFDADKALIKLTFVHGGKAKDGCRKRTAKELAKLAPNMRMKTICSRKRLPVMVELDIDGKRAYEEVLPPSGLNSDGPSMAYVGFPIDTGPHKIAIRMRDSDRSEGYDYSNETEVTLKPMQNFVIQFRPEFGGFNFQ